ncbi:MAG: nitrate/nitrite-specific signal transduction histidine kinase [Verrucomicrobiales bacterium]|jgi:nitrate/nitrite-specific signal transduction histidine kinase
MTERLIEANSGLERKVEERTAELESSNADLAQFAWIADLLARRSTGFVL